MALSSLFGRKLKGENKYFKSRKGVAPDKPASSQETKTSQKSAAQPQEQPGKSLVCERMINRDLLTQLLKTMRAHDVDASVAVLANTIDNSTRQAGIMINKGYIPKRIVSYLQNINMKNIDDAIKLVKTSQPDSDGFHSTDERTAADLNLPLGCMLLGISHHLRKEFAIVIVMRTGLKNKSEFLEKIRKLIQR